MQTDGVIAVTRALRLLEAFGMDDAQLTLAELSRRTGMHKTTACALPEPWHLTITWCKKKMAVGDWAEPLAGWVHATKPLSTCTR